MNVALVVLRCRTSDRGDGGGAGAEALGRELGERLGVEPRIVGSPQPARDGRYEDDLRDARGCILEAGGQVDDALADGAFPVLLAGDCTVALTTLPAVARHAPRAWIVWLDAHGDFNTPDTTPSGYLGGMCLAGACGRWDAGLGAPAVDPTRVVMVGVRDLDAGERAELDLAGVARLRAFALPERLRGERAFVHLDLDVLDPDVLPAQFPAPHGMSAAALRDLLGELDAAATLVGIEVTGFRAPDGAVERATLAALLASVIAPPLEAACER